MNPNQNDPNNPLPAGGQPDLGATPPPASPNASLGGPPTPMSPLDNPMQAPPQPPPFDSGFNWSPPPQTTPESGVAGPSITPQDLYGSSPAPPPPPPPPIPPTSPDPSLGGPASPMGGPPPEAAPTDLSHLVANGSEQPVYAPPVTQPETLVAPQSGTDEIPNMPIENQSGGMPKWVLGLGIGILLAVVGASGYFILGIGKSAENTPASLPATTKQQTLTPPPSPITAPAPATESSSFGEVGGTKPATSAADLLKQRQGR